MEPSLRSRAVATDAYAKVCIKRAIWHAIVQSRRSVGGGTSRVAEDAGLLPDKRFLDPEEAASQREAAYFLCTALAALPPRYKQVLELRYGLTGDPPLTLQATGQRMNPQIGPRRVLEIERAALAKLMKLLPPQEL
jgi:DNA-directed RNA polymerase sigma subunit (sigma70/sigma32)